MLKIILALSILLVGFFSYQEVYIQNKFKNDETYARETMLQKDSEGRGFSDVVKDKIDSQFNDEEIKSNLYKYAKSARDVVKSKSEAEFISSSKDMLLKRGCALYSIKLKNTKKIDNTFIYDSEEMRNYYEYLSLYRFASRKVQYELNDWMNIFDYRINNDDKYNRHCK
jgi:hypothetical protein